MESTFVLDTCVLLADPSALLRFDEHDVIATSATVKIGVDSLDTDHDWRDKDLKSDQWFDAAIAVFQHNIEAFPERPDLYNSLGEAYAVKQDWKRAADCYQTVLAGAATDVTALESREIG